MEKKWKSTADVIKDNRMQCLLYAGFLQVRLFWHLVCKLFSWPPLLCYAQVIPPHISTALHCGTWVTDHNTTTKAFSNLRLQQQSGQMKGRERELESHQMTWEMEVQTGLWPNSCRDWWLCHATKCLPSANKGSGGPGEKCFLWQRRIQEVSSHIKLTASVHVHTLTQTCRLCIQLLLPSSPEFHPLLLFVIHLHSPSHLISIPQELRGLTLQVKTSSVLRRWWPGWQISGPNHQQRQSELSISPLLQQLISAHGKSTTCTPFKRGTTFHWWRACFAQKG